MKTKRSAATKPRKPIERDVQKECVAALESLGCRVFRRNAGMMPAEYKGRTRMIRLGEPGAADLFGVLPDGRHFEAEIKRDGERPRLDQILFLRSMRLAFWIDDAAECRKVAEALILGGRIVWGDGRERYRVETKGRDGKKVAHWVDGPSAEFEVVF